LNLGTWPPGLATTLHPGPALGNNCSVQEKLLGFMTSWGNGWRQASAQPSWPFSTADVVFLRRGDLRPLLNAYYKSSSSVMSSRAPPATAARARRGPGGRERVFFPVGTDRLARRRPAALDRPVSPVPCIGPARLESCTVCTPPCGFEPRVFQPPRQSLVDFAVPVCSFRFTPSSAGFTRCSTTPQGTGLTPLSCACCAKRDRVRRASDTRRA
jgi:hypothetical protein